MYGGEEKNPKIFRVWFYLENLPILNVSLFRPSSGHVEKKRKEKKEKKKKKKKAKVLCHSISVGSIIFQTYVM